MHSHELYISPLVQQHIFVDMVHLPLCDFFII